MPSASDPHGGSYTWIPKYGSEMSMHPVSPNGRTYRRCEFIAEEIYGCWADITGSSPSLKEMHYGVSRLLMPTLVDKREGIGFWLMSCRWNMQSYTILAAETMAYIFTLLEERWQIAYVGVLLNEYDIMVAGPLSSSEISDLDKGVFPNTLSYLGKPGYRFGASEKLARRKSAPALKLDQHVEPTIGEGADEAEDRYGTDNDPSLDTWREGHGSKLYSSAPLTPSEMPFRRGFSESALPSLEAFKRRESTWINARHDSHPHGIDHEENRIDEVERGRTRRRIESPHEPDPQDISRHCTKVAGTEGG